MGVAVHKDYDIVIVGSGFSGSLLAWILAVQGRSILLIDSGFHPRFAIGESSTPTADFLIRHLAERWGLSKLAPLATWGTWKAAYPDVVCGKKRGFSYYQHHWRQPYQDDSVHSQSYLVAASSADRFSDTHWLRSSVDQFFVDCASQAGVTCREGTSLGAARYDRTHRAWQLEIVTDGERRTVVAPWLVDASGGGAATADWVDNPRDDDWMRTRTRATYAHFDHVLPFHAGHAPDDPFVGDDAAQHHFVDQGWCWMLRFDNGVTSVGLVEKLDRIDHRANPDSNVDLRESLADYPSLAALLSQAAIVAPTLASTGGSDVIAQAVRTERLSRCRRQASAPGLILLPNAYGFVDPLHSTGIAHALSGVARVAQILVAPERTVANQLEQYNRALRSEIRWLDTLVAGCYDAMPNFERFIAFCSFYFIAAIHFEAVLVADPTAWPQGFLQADDQALLEAATTSLCDVNDRSLSDAEVTNRIRRRIGRWNHVGLLDPANRHRLAHTAVSK